MKTCVSTYSFNKLISRGEITELQTLEIAKKMGFDAVEVAMLCTPEGMSDTDYAKSLRAESDRVGIPIVNFCFGADLIGGENGNLDAEIERVKSRIDLAVIMGASSVRHDAAYGKGNFRSFDLALPRIAEGCRKISQYGEKCGIRTMVENHGLFAQDSDRVERLFNAVNYDNFSLLVDMGNFMCADDTPYIAVSRVAPYAGFAHAKDFYYKKASAPDPGKGFFKTRSGSYLKGTIAGHGDVDVFHCIAALKNAGYDGYISLEFEGMEDTLTALETGLENLKRYIAM